MDEETAIGGEYIVDVEIILDFTEASILDDLSKTIDYVKVNQIVKTQMSIPSKLIEHVAMRILDSLSSEIIIPAKYRIEIKKMSPPIEGEVDFVSVVMES